MIWLLWVIWSRRLLFGKTLLCHFFPPDTICCLFFGLHVIAEHYVQQPIPTLALPFILCLNRCHICYHWCLHMEGCRGVVCSPLLSMSAREKVERSPELSHNIKHELLQRGFFYFWSQIWRRQMLLLLISNTSTKGFTLLTGRFSWKNYSLPW